MEEDENKSRSSLKKKSELESEINDEKKQDETDKTTESQKRNGLKRKTNTVD